MRSLGKLVPLSYLLPDGGIGQLALAWVFVRNVFATAEKPFSLPQKKDSVKAVILAGGKGTRMGEFTRETPKPMLSIAGEPILGHQVKWLKHYGITDIILLVNHLKEPIQQHFKEGAGYGVSITYFEEPAPLGTVGGIKEIEAQLTEDFLVLYGDVMISMDLQRLLAFHKAKSSQCTLVLHPNDHPYDSDLVSLSDEARITRFYPKPHKAGSYLPNMVNAGAYVFSPAVFPFLQKGVKADFGRDIFPRITSEIQMYGYNTAEYLKDMGTPERWKEVEADVRSGKFERASYRYPQKAIFLDRDGVINEEISFISHPDDMRLYPFTAEAIKTINRSEYKAIVVTNQSVIARNKCTIEELKEIHNKMETELGQERAKLDALYYCPHHPDKGYPEEREEYKIDCECRKPKPGMLLDAVRDFNINLAASYIIGDNERDIRAGRNAGCQTVGVMTGYGIKKATCLPDYLFANLLEAARFITAEPYASDFEKLQFSHSPTVVLVGGLARSGKSTFTTYVEQRLKASGKKVLRINLDNWILPEAMRNEGMNVFDRFRLPRIEDDIQQILVGETCTLPAYLAHPDRKPFEVSYAYRGEDVVLIEGVVALSSPVLRQLAHQTVFIDIDPERHRQRIETYYRWKGKGTAAVDEIYQQRQADEYRHIEKECKLADHVVKSFSS